MDAPDGSEANARAATTPTTSSTAGRTPRSLLRASRSDRRARRSFASKNSRLSLTIDAEPTSAWDGSCGAGQSTPASTSSSSCSEVVPWWELEYKCPPPGHLGAHVVPVSVEEPHGSSAAQIEPSVGHGASPVGQLHPRRPGLALQEMPERELRRPRGYSTSALPSTPSLLVDGSPSQQRKTRRLHARDPSDPLSASVSKELKRSHGASRAAEMEPPRGRQRVLTPSTLLQPLTQIGISQTRASPVETTSSGVKTEAEAADAPRAPSSAHKPDYAASC